VISNGGKPAVLVIVLTLNEEANLPGCLDSLAGLDCEITIVDSGSNDGTLEIARERDVRVVQHPFENYSAQRNWAQKSLPTRANWVLHLDADERLTPELVKEINTLLQGPPTNVDGYLLRKRTIFMGRWMRHGGHYPSFHLRLFRPEKGCCEDRLYDQHFVVTGRIQALRNDYLDIVASDITTWSARHLRWARLEAEEALRPETSASHVKSDLFGSPIERKRWLRNDLYGRAPLLVRPFLYWTYRYMLRLGFLDGVEGMIFHFLQACWFRFVTDCLILERRLKNS